MRVIHHLITWNKLLLLFIYSMEHKLRRVLDNPSSNKIPFVSRIILFQFQNPIITNLPPNKAKIITVIYQQTFNLKDDQQHRQYCIF